MGWSLGFDNNWDRDIGYGVPAECDHPKCHEQIHRGLAYVCGSEPYGGEHGCGLYLCSAHLFYKKFRDGCFVQVCQRCRDSKSSYKAKPDVQEWINHKMTDPSWAKWRENNPDFVKQYDKSR